MNFTNYIKYSLEGRLFKKMVRKIKTINLLRKNKKFNIYDDKSLLIEKFKINHKCIPNVENPVSFNEKMLWSKIYWRSNLAKRCSDKLAFKDYLDEKGLSNNYAKTIKIYNTLDDFLGDLNNLPKECVIKTNQDSGTYFIKTSKTSALNFKKGIKKIVSGYNKGSFKQGDEWVYDGIQPKIFVEELLKNNSKHSIDDYKFFCFNGEPKYLFVGSKRDTLLTRFDFFDMQWNWLKVKNVHHHLRKHPEKPDNFDQMVSICRKLAAEFSQVRVDLYSTNGKVYIGELTFFHFGGNEDFKPKTFDHTLGELWDLSTINKNEIVSGK